MCAPAETDDPLVRYAATRARSAELRAESHRLRETSAKLRLQVREQRQARQAAGSPDGNGHTPLTRRQLEILLLIADGHGTKAIAAHLWLSAATVRNHVSAILPALGAHSRLEAVANARRLGLLAPTDGHR